MQESGAKDESSRLSGTLTFNMTHASERGTAARTKSQRVTRIAGVEKFVGSRFTPTVQHVTCRSLRQSSSLLALQVTTRKKSLVAQTNYLPTRTVPRSVHPGGEASNRWAIMQKLRLLTASIHCPPQRLCWRGAPRDLTAQKKVLRCVAAPPRCLLRGGGCGLVVVKQLKTLADANGPAFVA